MDLSAREVDAPPPGATIPMIEWTVVVLPMPFRPRRDIRSGNLQVNAEQGLARTVEGLVVGWHQTAPAVSSPKYACRTASSERISSGVPVAMTLP